MIYRFHHAHIICKDLEQMINFFTDVLNARLISRLKFGTAEGASIDVQGITVNLRVPRADEIMAADASETRYGFDHIGLEVEDVDAAFNDLARRGYNFFMPPTDIPNLRIAFFKGPEDITIELVQSKV